MSEYSIVTGHDGRMYIVFANEHEADVYQDINGLGDIERYCCNGYMNAFLYYDVYMMYSWGNNVLS